MTVVIYIYIYLTENVSFLILKKNFAEVFNDFDKDYGSKIRVYELFRSSFRTESYLEPK